MKQLEQQEIAMILPFYKDATDSTIYAYLDGYMGKGFVDCKENISHTIILQGDFVFPSNGEGFDEEIALSMMKELTEIKDKNSFLIIPQTKEWEEFLKNNEMFSSFPRYHFEAPTAEQFDVKILEEICEKLPKQYRFERIDETLYPRVMAEDWSRDFCSNFASAKDFLAHGLGIVVMEGDTICGGASSYTAYKKGIEVEIVTRKEYRNQGIASACGAKLILTCLAEQKLPHWDAANETSVRLAKRLGFEYLGAYDTYYIAK